MILTILFVILVFSLLVLAHEFGHYIVAKRNGVQVDEFGIGFPPKVWGVQKGKTLYSINALPLGGFVRLKGEQGDSKANDSFASQRAWVKSKILLAGVTINLLIAYVLITGLLIVGVPPLLSQKLPTVAGISPSSSQSELLVVAVGSGSVAEQSGISVGSKLVKINDQQITTPEQLKEVIDRNAGGSILVEMRKDGKTQVFKVALPASNGEKALLGVSTIPEKLQSYPAYIAPVAAVAVVGQMIWATLAAFGGMIVGLFTRAEVSQAVTGPIGITVIFSEVLKYGASYVVALVASISLSLAIINSLPLPALDGGRLLIVVLQRIGIKITDRTEAIVHTLGFVALIALMIVVSITDIIRIGG